VRRPADATGIAAAAAILRAGGLVAFPTETVYGLGAHALDTAAVRRIFAAKGRPAFNPLIVHVLDIDAARALVTTWSPVAQTLAERFWPGPLTIVLPRRPIVPDVITGGGPTVAIRSPAHPVARALLEATGLPIAAPSANRFTELSPVTAEQVERSLGDRDDRAALRAARAGDPRRHRSDRRGATGGDRFGAAHGPRRTHRARHLERRPSRAG